MNKSTKTIFIITILLLLNVGAIYPADYEGGRDWMILPPSARAAGMGRALVAIVDNANTVFWNPGGITFLEGLNISYNYEPKHMRFLGDFEIHNMSLSKKLKSVYFIGFNVRREYENKRRYRDSDIGISFGYNENDFGIGITTKFLYSKPKKYILHKGELIKSKNPSFAADIGVLYSKDYGIKNGYMLQVNVGSSLLNISKGIKFTDYTEWGIPCIFRLGYALKLITPKGEGKLKWLTIANNLEYLNIMNRDRNKTEWNYLSLGCGFEFAVYEILFFRIGYHYQRDYFYSKSFNHPYYKGHTYGLGICLPVNYINKSLPLSITYDFAQFPWDLKSEFKKERYFLIHSLNFNYKF